MSLRLAFIIPDTHAPYHHVKANKLVQLIANDLQPDEIVFLGDVADYYAVNSHGRHPGLLHTLVEEIDQVNKFIDGWDKCPGKKVYLIGNHENRLERFIYHRCPELFQVTEIDKLMRLNERGWRFIDYGPNQIYSVLGSKLKARHEPSGTTAKLSAQKSGCSLVYGHIHRIEQAYSVHMVTKDEHVNFCPGWLGDKSYDKIFGYVKHHHQWQLGFGIVWVDPKTRNFYHQIIPILPDISAVVNGKRYRL